MIDLASGGIFAAILGNGISSKPIRDTVIGVMGLEEQAFCSYSTHRQDYWRDRYISMLKELTGFESVALFSTGSEATEAFWRVCRVFYGKPGVWGGLVDPDDVGKEGAKCDQMHGVTLGAMIMAGRMTWTELGVFPELGESRFGTKPEATSCMIMEPYHAPSGQFHRFHPTIKRVMMLQETYKDIPLCMDEIQGGFGRTGKLWAYQHYDNSVDIKMTVDEDGTAKDHCTIIDHPLKPDFITIGKLCGGGLPLSALLGPADIMGSKEAKEFGHLHSTHSGNPLMCAVGCAVIEEMQKQNLVEESARKGLILHGMLSQFPVKSHGKGLLAGLVMESAGETKKVVDLCLTRGVQVVDTGRKWVKIGPELTIADDDLIQGVKILQEVVEEVVHARESAACGGSGEGPGGVDPVLQVV